MFKKLRAQLCLASVSNRKDIEMFWSSDQLPLEHLFGEQIIAILKIIDAELLISFSFGLKILRNDVIKEKIEILKVLNSFGNLSAIPNQLTFEAARTFILNYLGQTMIDEAKFYFNNAKEGEVKNKYN